MSDHEFEKLLTQALIQSTRQTWLEQPSEEALLSVFPETETLDKKIRGLRRGSAESGSNRAPLYRRIGRIAAMFFLTITILFGALMLHPEARAYILNLVTTWHEDHVTALIFTLSVPAMAVELSDEELKAAGTQVL